MRDRRDDPGASHLKGYRFKHGGYLLGGKLERDGESGRFAGISERLLISFLVDFNDNAVDKIFFVVFFLRPLLPIGNGSLDMPNLFEVAVHLESKSLEEHELFELGIGNGNACGCRIVYEVVELSTCRDFRVKLADGTGSGVARVREGRLPFALAFLIQSLQSFFAHPYLPFRNDINGVSKHKRHRLDRPDIVRYVLPYDAVSAGCRSGKHSFFILKNDLEPVYLKLAGIGRMGACREKFFQ